MKILKKILLLFFFGIDFCKAQDSILLISRNMFSVNSEEIFLCEMNGWVFKEGNDASWAKKDIDFTGWEKFKPTELSPKQADKNGKVEGWFRLKIKLDAGLENKPYGFNVKQWAASDLYLDGSLLASYGNTGQNGRPFQEYRSNGKISLPVYLKPDSEYTIALHVVDYLAPLPPYHIKSTYSGLNSMLSFAGPNFNSNALKVIKRSSTYSTVWISVCAVLTLIFWFLSIQNPFERYLRLISLCSTFITGYIVCETASRNTFGLSFIGFTSFSYIGNLFVVLGGVMIPLILSEIFRKKLPLAIKIFLVVFSISWMVNLFLNGKIVYLVLLFLLVAVCMYYIISCWKGLQGSQWAIVAGLLLLSISALLYVHFYSFQNSNLYFLAATGVSLSFPTSLMIYVVLRFKEIMLEVQNNSQLVLKLSEENREQALNQQRILQQEVIKQTAEIRTTLDNLKSAQSQLIQSEKMASLGELTAGIAHEIQNPLNFVNNFSEVNKELLVEMKEEMEKGNLDDAKSIASDVIENQKKINHHGKRADAIVKGMLQHSRSSSGQKESTDITALCDEYLRLAYHGLRAKDRSFNAEFKTDFDESIGPVNVVPQDIGRVLLNLINNAFYAVHAKASVKADDNYEPVVSVSTKKSGNEIEILVADNGNGIPRKILDKIFQPFFTTKPTGEGTGLGLSLAYDIIKAHGGNINVETVEGEGTTFIISLPVN